jgi:hypothetical protein
MKMAIPVFLYIEVASHEQALAAKQIVAQLLSNGIVTTMLASNGVQSEGIAVGEPRPLTTQASTRR